jgi:hypothetical protein
VTLAPVPADRDGPAHDHWLLGYRFSAPVDTALVPERDPVAWHDVAALPHSQADDLLPLLEELLADQRR